MRIEVCNWGFVDMSSAPSIMQYAPRTEKHAAGYELNVADEADLGRVLLGLMDNYDLMLQKREDKIVLWLDSKGGRFRCR